MAWQTTLTPLRAADADGSLRSSQIVAAFDYACREGARIVNGSFAGPGSTAIRDAIDASPATLRHTSLERRRSSPRTGPFDFGSRRRRLLVRLGRSGGVAARPGQGR